MRARQVVARRVCAAAHIIALLMLAAASQAHAQAPSIKLSSAWMRPALAGDNARAYVDIASDTALTLTQATTPVANAVEIVVAGASGNAADETVVASMPVAAGTALRLAFRGNHLRFVGVHRNLVNGETIPVTLHLAETDGRVTQVSADVLVRGFTVRPAAPDLRRP